MGKIHRLFTDENAIGYNLNFLDEAKLWFDFTDDRSMLVFFNFISEEHIYASLRSICAKHGAKERIKGRENDEPIYVFKIPSVSSVNCYEELKRHSVP